jgi:hypothetical protein
MSDYYPKTIKQGDGSLIKVLVANHGTLGYYMEYPGCWRLIWQYDNWRNGPLPEALPFVVKSVKYAEALIQQLNPIVAPSRISYVHGTEGKQPKVPAEPKECMTQLEQEYGDWLSITPDATPSKQGKRNRKAPEGWQAQDYNTVEIFSNQWDKKIPVTVKYGFIRGMVGACSNLSKIELTHLPTGMSFATCQDYEQASKYADLITEMLPVGEWGIAPEGEQFDKTREAMIALRASLSEHS